MTREFNPEMLILARESRGVTQTDLARLTHVQQGTISKVESGILPASEELVAKFSLALNYPDEFFFQPDRVYGFNSTVFFHRKRQSLPDKVLRKLHAEMNITRMRIARLLRATELAHCNFQRIEPEEYAGNAEKIAQLVRSTWLIPSGSVRNLMKSIEDAGGIVVRLDFGMRQADAISEWIPPFPPMFLVNSNSEITGDRLRMTLAHEIGHVIMHRFPNPKMEKEANLFAAEFLMPRREIKPELFGLTLGKLADLKQQWGVSMAALAQRAYELKTITTSQHRYLFIQLGRAGLRLREPPSTDVPIERPSLLHELLKVHLDQLGYTTEELAKLMMMNHEDELRATYLDPDRLRLVG